MCALRASSDPSIGRIINDNQISYQQARPHSNLTHTSIKKSGARKAIQYLLLTTQMTNVKGIADMVTITLRCALDLPKSPVAMRWEILKNTHTHSLG